MLLPTSIVCFNRADLVLDGEPRKVLMQAPKNGFFYVLDRATGELISADAYATVTWTSGVDLDSGHDWHP